MIVSVNLAPTTLPGTQAKIQTLTCEEQLEVRTQMRSTGKQVIWLTWM